MLRFHLDNLDDLADGSLGRDELIEFCISNANFRNLNSEFFGTDNTPIEIGLIAESDTYLQRKLQLPFDWRDWFRVPEQSDNKFEGSKYQATKHLDIKEIAKLIRQDIKKQYPEIKVSVRIGRFSGGESLDVRIKTLYYNPVNPEYNPHEYHRGNQVYINQYLELVKSLKGIVNQYRDYFDNNFYSNVDLDHDFWYQCYRQLGIK